MNSLLLKSVWVRLLVVSVWIAVAWGLFFWVVRE